jgi:hypothetical protein
MVAMSQANRIRQFTVDRYIAPAIAAGRDEITIRAGDVHREMGLTNAMPAVCSALGSRKFDVCANITRSALVGPTNGANVYFTFKLSGRPPDAQIPRKHREPAPLKQAAREIALSLSGAVVLVSCVKSKLSHSAPARALYTSAWFEKVRDIVEASGARWFVLSSRYGLVAPTVEIAPYDYTLNSLGVRERQAWAKDVLNALLPLVANEKRIVMFAGDRYREFLIQPLRRNGIEVEVPMAHLRRGEQLSWLSNFQ